MSVPETKPWQHLSKLAGEIGARPGGAPGNAAAAEYIRQVFQDCGLEVEVQSFDCPTWEEQQTLLELNGERLEAGANAFSPPCDVQAPVVPAGTLAELEAADLRGRIGILYGDLCKSPLSPKSWFLKSDSDDRLIQLLEQKEPAALITVQARPGLLERVIEDWEFNIPSATVPAQTGLALMAQRGAEVHLKIDSRRSPGHSWNVIARKAGETERRIVLCAHYDTKFDTPGAFDNASGVAVLLALAQKLAFRKLPFNLEWVAFGNEEYLPLGDDFYARKYEQDFKDIVTAINFDGVGQTLAANSITLVAGSQPFQHLLSELTQNYPGVVWVEPWPESNHSTFSWRGVPSIAISSAGAVRVDHLRSDTLDWVSQKGLDEVITLAGEILDNLQEKSTQWTRE
jgi:aminopeptidase YwaD